MKAKRLGFAKKHAHWIFEELQLHISVLMCTVFIQHGARRVGGDVILEEEESKGV